jgi:hypothetical protein
VNRPSTFSSGRKNNKATERKKKRETEEQKEGTAHRGNTPASAAASLLPYSGKPSPSLTPTPPYPAPGGVFTVFFFGPFLEGFAG